MKYFSYRSTLRHLLLVGITILFSSCGSPEQSSQDTMPAEKASDSAQALTESVAAENMKPGPLGLILSGASSGIKTDYFEQVAVEAIMASGIFSSIDNSKTDEIIIHMLRAKGAFPGIELSGNAPYVLKIRIIKVEAPAFSMRMNVSMKVVWTLSRTADKTTLMHEIINSNYIGGAFEGGIIGSNRVRVGTEGAARENVRIGVGMLEALDFEPETPDTEQEMPEADQEAGINS